MRTLRARPMGRAAKGTPARGTPVRATLTDPLLRPRCDTCARRKEQQGVQQDKPAITDEEMAGCYCPGPRRTVHAYPSDEEHAATDGPVTVVAPRSTEGMDVARSDDGGADDTKETDTATSRDTLLQRCLSAAAPKEPVGTLGCLVSEPSQGSAEEEQQLEEMESAGGGEAEETPPLLLLLLRCCCCSISVTCSNAPTAPRGDP
jgi:hypothetical protein